MAMVLEFTQDRNIGAKLAEIAVRVACKKCSHEWGIPFGQVGGEVKCPECSGQNEESGTG